MTRQLGHYEIVGELGRGGMGVVWKALDPALGRVVAIKELAPTLADDPALVERFLREARSMAALSDPHIVNIHFIGQEHGRPFFVMELVDGESLSSILRRLGRLELADALKIVHQTARGLACAHERGVVHRDIKPGNLLLDTRGRVRIADFGIALPTRDPAQKLTGTGEFIGTPGYVSPEICKGQGVDARSDIFSLGVVLFEMLSGRMPFTDASPLGLMLEVVNAQIPDLRALNDQVDAETLAILARMVAKEPAERYQDGAELASALAAHPLVADGRPPALVVRPPTDSQTAAMALQQPRVPTPPPVLSPSGAASTAPRAARAAPAAAPAVAAATVARATPAGRHTMRRDLLLVAAVVLVLGGTAFAFRGYLGEFGNGFRDGFVAGRISNPVPASHADGTPTTAAGATAAGGATSGGGMVTGTSSALAPVAGGSDASAAGAQPVGGKKSAPADGGGADSAAPATASAAADAPAASGPAATPTATPDAPPAAAAAAAAIAAVPASARTAPAPRRAQAPPPAPPRVVVVALGDRALAGPAQQRIESYLADAGHQLADAETIAGLSGADDVAGMLQAARRHARVLVLVRAEVTGSRELYFHGNHDTAFSALLSARAYDTASGQPLAPGFRHPLEFAALNAAARANEALDPELARLERSLAPALRGRDRG
jgi:serine/threonine-protein kinase